MNDDREETAKGSLKHALEAASSIPSKDIKKEDDEDEYAAIRAITLDGLYEVFFYTPFRNLKLL